MCVSLFIFVARSFFVSRFMRFSFVSSCFVLFCSGCVCLSMCVFYFIGFCWLDTNISQFNEIFVKRCLHTGTQRWPLLWFLFHCYCFAKVMSSFFICCGSMCESSLPHTRTQKHCKFVYLSGEKKYYVLIMRGSLNDSICKEWTPYTRYTTIDFRLWSHHLRLPYNIHSMKFAMWFCSDGFLLSSFHRNLWLNRNTNQCVPVWQTK